MLLATLDVTDAVPAGTVGVPSGRWGCDPSGGGADSLTSDLLGHLANGPAFCVNLVEVRLPSVKAG
jgi:anaerobic selenocysteine-containing dehydrogenase